ncbi:MAG: hypothetical protein V1726_05525 [Methanobacteriota archaeon]
MVDILYECQSCKRTFSVNSSKKAPVCCGKPMKKVPREICLQPSHSEHARPMESDEPCDDFRAGE